jgi:uncharacterized protein DUF6526
MADRVQTYKNHVRLLPVYHFFVIPVLLLNVVNEVRRAYYYPSAGRAVAVVVAIAILTLGLLARTMPLRAQDRMIRLEMRMRLQQVLPPDLRARIGDLTPEQLVALRFACDAELPDMVRDVLEGRLKTGKEIKMRVKDWQADWLRV